MKRKYSEWIGLFLFGLLCGWWLYGPDGIAEAPAAEVRQPDDSIVLERNPEAKPATPEPSLPGKPVRIVEVTVQPKKPKQAVRPKLPGPDGVCPMLTCPALTVRLDLVDQVDGQRVIASSPDGEIVGGIDIPLEPLVRPKRSLWEAGITMSDQRQYGVFIDRDVGPFRLGFEADAGSIRLKAGIKF